MKVVCIVLLSLFASIASAKNAQTNLLKPLALNEFNKKQNVEAEVITLLKTKHKTKDLKLIGKSTTTKGKNGQVITQFAFCGIEKKSIKGKRQIVLLKKPAVGAVIANKVTAILPEDLIPIQFDEADLIAALEDLLAGRNLATEPKTFNAGNPLGEIDSLNVVDLAAKREESPGSLSAGLSEANEQAQADDHTSSSSLGDRRDVFTETTKTTAVSVANNSSSSSRSMQRGQDGQMNRQNMEPATVNPQVGDRNLGGDPNPSSVARNATHPNVGRGFPAGAGDVANIPSLPAASRAAVSSGASRGSADPRNSAAVALGEVPVEIADASPIVEFRTSCDGCAPRVDREHNKVIIQEKTIRLENNAVIETGPCEDTLEQYDIYKDFLCDGCTIFVDSVRRVAFDKYKSFWINQQNQKIVLDEEPQIDLTEPHPFMDESGDCGYEFDEQLGVVYPRISTIFADRFNGKHVVEACHRSPTAEAIRVVEVDCALEHEFAANRSFLRKKKVFTVDGVEHVAKECARAGEAIEHEFVTATCQPILDQNTGVVTPLARRKIRTPLGDQYITECEPLADTDLIGTTEGCEDNLFHHDFITGRSYFNKRYYYIAANSDRVYCTGCLRSSELVAHEYENDGYQHDDNRHLSWRKMATVLAFQLLGIPQRLRISEGEVRPGADALPHDLVRTENRALGSSEYIGCHRVTQSQVIQHYSRADGSNYEVVAGRGVPVQGPNECRYEIRVRGTMVSAPSGSYFDRGDGDYSENYVTTTTLYFKTNRVYPDNRSELVNSDTITNPSVISWLNVCSNPTKIRYTYSYTCPVSRITKRFNLISTYGSTELIPE